MIDNALWWIWHVGEFVAVVGGWYIILVAARGFMRGARQVGQEYRRGIHR